MAFHNGDVTTQGNAEYACVCEIVSVQKRPVPVPEAACDPNGICLLSGVPCSYGPDPLPQHPLSFQDLPLTKTSARARASAEEAASSEQGIASSCEEPRNDRDPGAGARRALLGVNVAQSSTCR